MLKEDIEKFSDGIRMLMLRHRSKEGGSSNDKKSVRKISRNKEEFFKILEEFRKIKNESQEPLRIYSCVNCRNIEKAIMNLKRKQLEADFYDKDSRDNFYFDIKNRWISSLMKPNARKETFFLIDVDNLIGSGNTEILDEHLKDIGAEVVAKYPTKNGIHIITKPFNPNLFNSEFGEIKKDALLLLDY